MKSNPGHPSIVAIIAARGGSRGIPDKNIRPLAGQPLLAYSVKLARSLVKNKLLDRVILTTDSPKIASVGSHYGAEVPFLRPARLSTGKSQMRDVLLHALDWLKINQNYRPDYFLLLQPTAPLREVEDITACLREMKKPSTDAVVVVSPTETVSFFVHNGYLKPAPGVPDLKRNTNRQAMPLKYRPIGSAFLVKTAAFLKAKTIFPPRTRFVVCPRWRALDIDHPEDFIIAELLLKNKSKIKNRLKSFS